MTKPAHSAHSRATIARCFAIVALVLVVAGCGGDNSNGDSVDGNAVIETTTQALVVASIQWVNGTYGGLCAGRAGAWSARFSGSNPMTNPALTVAKNNSACVLTVTALVADQTYTAAASIALTTSYQGSPSAFQAGGLTAFYANALISATTFLSDFVVTVLVSSDAGDVGVGVTASMLEPTSLKWFGSGTYSQGAWDLIARRSPQQEATGATTWSMLTAGSKASCGLRTDGTVWCWGDNGSGQLGTGNVLNENAPTQVGVSTQWISVSTSGQHTCGVLSTGAGNGTIYCWGKNESGQVGNGGTVTPQLAPVIVSGGFTNWIAVAAGGSVGAGASHTCGIRSTGAGNGTLYCWGSNGSGELGTGNTTASSSPVLVGALTNWKTVSAGSLHGCGTLATGKLYCWGDNTFGQVGMGGVVTPQKSPVQVGALTTWNGISAAADASHSCATKTDGTLWCWGTNTDGEVGIGSQVTPQTSPVQVGALTTWRNVSAGRSHACATKTDNTLWCWGKNDVGQVGIGSLVTPQTSPVQVGALTVWSAAAAGSSHACAIRTGGGAVWCWGSGSFGQIGIGQFEDSNATVAVGVATNWANATAGSGHACGTRGDGTLWCWGRNDNGQIGVGSVTTPQSTPIQVGVATTWSTVAAGTAHTCGTRTDGTLWCWGFNNAGQLGLGNTSQQTSPVQVGSLTTWKRVAAGDSHTCATRTDRTLWCWGSNVDGQIGIGNTTTPQTSPVQVGVATTWSTIGAGNLHTCATKTDGTLWCWGDNTSGEIGIGSVVTPQSSPVQVGAATSWQTVSAGSSHACATKTDGTLWCWGDNTSGEIGIGSVVTPQNSPLQVGTAATWNSVASGNAHTCATRTDQTLWCWGLNTSGEVGIGDNVTPQTSPGQVPLYERVRRVYSGPMASTNLVATIGAAAYRATIAADGPAGYWPLDDTNSPSLIGNVQDPPNAGIPVGGASVTYGQAGIITSGTSINFANTSVSTNKVSVAYDSGFNPTGDFSVETWINFSAATGAAMSAITSRETSTARGYSLYVQANNVVSFVVGNGGATFVTVVGSAAITAGTSHHVVGTYVKSTGLMTLYVDGIKQTATGTALSYTPASPGIPLYIGCGGTEGTGQFGFNGRIDETAVYNRTLPAAEVSNHYEVGLNSTTVAGKALYFSGNNAFVDIGALAIPADFTFEAWILRDPSALEGTIMAKDRAVQAAGQCRLAVDPSGHLYFEGSDSTGNDHGLWNTTFQLLSPAVIPIGTWTHVAVTKSAAVFVLYVNGASVISFTANANFAISGPATPFRVGSRVASDGISAVLPFAGAIDEVRVWTGARSAAKISGNMSVTIPGNSPDFPALAGYWRFDEGSGTTTADATGHLPGTLTAGPVWVTSTAF